MVGVEPKPAGRQQQQQPPVRSPEAVATVRFDRNQLGLQHLPDGGRSSAEDGGEYYLDLSPVRAKATASGNGGGREAKMAAAEQCLADFTRRELGWLDALALEQGVLTSATVSDPAALLGARNDLSNWLQKHDLMKGGLTTATKQVQRGKQAGRVRAG